MTAELPQHLHAVVEAICASGCQRVNQIISLLDDQGDCAETVKLSALERAQVLAELKRIMSVYKHD